MSMLNNILCRASIVVAASVITLGLFLVLPVMQSAVGQPKFEPITLHDPVIHLPAPPDQPELEQKKPNDTDKKQIPAGPLPADLTRVDPLINTGPYTIPVDVTPSIPVPNTNFDKPLDTFDQPARVVNQPGPRSLPEALRKRTPASVLVMLIVIKDGRVIKAAVQSSTDPSFDRLAVDAVKRWSFDAATRQGKPVAARIRVTITFPQE